MRAPRKRIIVALRDIPNIWAKKRLPPDNDDSVRSERFRLPSHRLSRLFSTRPTNYAATHNVIWLRILIEVACRETWRYMIVKTRTKDANEFWHLQLDRSLTFCFCSSFCSFSLQRHDKRKRRLSENDNDKKHNINNCTFVRKMFFSHISYLVIRSVWERCSKHLLFRLLFHVENLPYNKCIILNLYILLV